MEDRIIRTCSRLAFAFAVSGAALASPAFASKTVPANSGLAYVQARAASMSGDRTRAAQLFAGLADANAGDTAINRRAMVEAIGAGQMALALRLARRIPSNTLGIDARLLLAVDALKRDQHDQAAQILAMKAQDAQLDFLIPLVRAWASAEARDLAGARAHLDQVPANSVLQAYADENRALILLRFGRAEEAEAYARRAIGGAGGREVRLRLAFADAFLAAGDRQRALAMLDGMGTETGAARQRVLGGRPTGQAIATAEQAFSELLLGLAVDLNRSNNRSLPIALAQIARFADPRNSAASVLLALLLDGQGRPAEALAILDGVGPSDALAAQARDVAVRILMDEKRLGEAHSLARAAASRPNASVSDIARVGDVLERMGRFSEAADAYGRAIAMAQREGMRTEQWPLQLLRAGALEAADRWPEAKSALESAMAIAPEEPLILNFLGYAKLERGEDLDLAEAMIRKASRLAPQNASITDSLGWALFKRGRLPDAIATLQRAAAADPQQAEIHEHLGDALYTAGRRYEARFAWEAALITAEDEIAERVKAKLESGLTPATAAP